MSEQNILQLIEQEHARQTQGMELIPSENYVSKDVLAALGSIMTNKYSEGYPGARYYGGQKFVDQIETLAQERAKKLFHVEHANVQPYSGSPANFAVYVATCQPGDTVMGLNLSDGGHLTHGWKVSATAMFYNSIPYHVKEDGRIDMDEVRKLALEHKPKLMWMGATAYVFKFDYEAFAKIADEVGALLVADIAHVAGLIIAGVHPDPEKFADIITSTTHKTLRGPRGGIIMVTKKGIAKDPKLAEKIDKAIFPGLQGGPHDHQTAAIAVALGEADSPEFKQYGQNIIDNTKPLVKVFNENNIKMVGGGTENHMLLLDLTPIFGPGGGVFVQEAFETACITTNKNTIPKDPSSPFYPSGLRLGVPAMTTRGFGVSEFLTVGQWMSDIIHEIKDYRLPEDKEARKEYLKTTRSEIHKNKMILEIKNEVAKLCVKFPLPSDK